MIKDYIDEDIVISDDLIKDLYDLSQSIKDKKTTKDDVLLMYRLISEYGIVDNSIDEYNKFYKKIFDEGYNSGILYTNPFIIPASKINKFMTNQYENMETEEEMVGNAIVLSNRLSKVPGLAMNVKSGKPYQVSALGWSKEKTEVMEEFFRIYESKKDKTFDFLKDVEFDKNNWIKSYNKEKYKDKAEFEHEYRKFKFWYNEKINILLKKHPEMNKLDFQFSNIPNLQKLFRLKESEAIFYQVKDLNIERAIQLRKNNKIKVTDGTKFDNKKRDDSVLLYIELPKYNAPIMVHLKKNIYQNEILSKIPQSEIPEEKKIKYDGFPHWYFRLNDEQIKLIKSISDNTLKDDTFGTSIMYMQNSIYFKETIDKMELREEKKREEQEKMKEELERQKKLEAKASRKKLKGNNEFIDEDIVPVVEQQLGKNMPEAYVQGLKASPKNSHVAYVYNTVNDFLKEKTGEQDKDILTVEATKMFTYMKLGQRAFWSGVNGKKDRQALYTEISNEYEGGFKKIGEAIDKNMKLEDLPKFVKPEKKRTRGINIENILRDTQEENEEEKVHDNPTEVEYEIDRFGNARITNEPQSKNSIETEFAVNDDSIGERIDAQTQKNSKLEQVIAHQKEYISNQERLIALKQNYAELLNEATEKKQIIAKNDEILKAKGDKISELEKELFADREEK